MLLGKFQKLSFYSVTALLLFVTSNAYSHANLFGRYNEAVCTGEGDAAICLAVGFRMEPVSILSPLLVKSIDGGKNYRIEKNMTEMGQGTLLTVDCSEEKDPAHCVAAGYLGDSKAHATPLLMESKNSAKSWKIRSIEGVTQGLIKKIRCTGNKLNAFCAGIGWGVRDLSDSTPVPFIFQNNSCGKWKKIPIQNMPALATLTVLSCTDSSENAMCVAGGYDKEHQTPWVVLTRDGGKHWAIQDLGFKLDKAAEFADVSCAGKGPTATCVIVGNSGPDDLIIQTGNRGLTWAHPAFPNPLKWVMKFPAVNCNEKAGGNIQCRIAGYEYSTNSQSYFARIGLLTENGWERSYVQEPFNTVYHALTCTKGGDECIAVGEKYRNGNIMPVLHKNTHINSAWTEEQITNYPYNGLLRASSCTGTGKSLTCIAAGYNNRFGDAPLLIQSRDGGNSWIPQDLHL